MRKNLIAAASLSLGLAASAAGAYAGEPTEGLCRNMDLQVGTALEANQSTGRDEAVRERNSARAYCNRGYYKLGTQHFAQALKLLGAQKT
jgi:hypothetical protein